jgi:hypothetical protein
MEINATPRYDASVNTTGCCPKFNPAGWDGQELHFRDKPFVRATTRSVMHVPLNMGKVFTRVGKHIDDASAQDTGQALVLSRDTSPWESEHFFAVTAPVRGEEMTSLSGDFTTRVFEGPYRQAREWHKQLREIARGHDGEARIFFFYTTCPKCAKAYGRNYVVGVAEL